MIYTVDLINDCLDGEPVSSFEIGRQTNVLDFWYATVKDQQRPMEKRDRESRERVALIFRWIVLFVYSNMAKLQIAGKPTSTDF